MDNERHALVRSCARENERYYGTTVFYDRATRPYDSSTTHCKCAAMLRKQFHEEREREHEIIGERLRGYICRATSAVR